MVKCQHLWTYAHPFREGNGRLARLLSTLMGLQAGLPFFDFSAVEGKNREMYFVAVQADLDRNYKPMEQIFSGIISRSLQVYDSH
jgi:cell filamentation protein